MTDYTGPTQVAQLRMARAGLGWSQKRLAEASGVPFPIYKGIKEGRNLGYVSNMALIRETLEHAGVEFIEENGAGLG